MAIMNTRVIRHPLTVVAIGIVMACSDTTASEERLRVAIRQKFEYWSQGRYDVLWDSFTSERLKAGNDNDRSGFIEDLRKAGAPESRVEIHSIRIEDRRATVDLTVHVRMQDADKWLPERLKERWIWEKGRWVYDGPVVDSASKDSTTC